MEIKDMPQIVYNVAVRSHIEWCDGELQDYHSRVKKFLLVGNPLKEAVEMAKIKAGKERYSVELLCEEKLFSHYAWLYEEMQTFEGFKNLIRKGYIKVEKIANIQGTVTIDPIDKDASKENLLTSFKNLSSFAKREILALARISINVFDDYERNMKRFVSDNVVEGLASQVYFEINNNSRLYSINDQEEYFSLKQCERICKALFIEKCKERGESEEESQKD